jgi:hypothetical protein
VRLEGLGKVKECNNLIGMQTLDVPAGSTAPQPSTLPRTCILVPSGKCLKYKLQVLVGCVSHFV